MNLVEVDVIGLKTFEAALDRIHDMAARGAEIVGAGTHAAIEFGGDDNIRALGADLLEGLAKELLGVPLRVHIGGVEKIDAGLNRACDERRGALLVEIADHLEHALA